MSNIAVKKQTSDLISFDSEKLELIKNTIARDLDNGQFALFIEYAKSKGLDPIQRQVHAVTRYDSKLKKKVMSIQTGIDGFRLIAARTGEYAGKDEAEFTYGEKYPEKCKVTVYKLVGGQRCPFTATARWDEYYPGEQMGFMWRKMPETMLEKCAEAKALRMAFPADLSGLHVDEEMHQADNPQPIRDVSETTREIQDDNAVQVDKIVRAFARLNVTKDQICGAFLIDDISELTEENINELREIHAKLRKGEAKTNDFFGGE